MAKRQAVASETAAAAAVAEAAGKPAGSGAISASPARRRVPWFRFTIMILFGIVYAWDLFAAFTNFFGKLDELARVNEVRELNGFPLVAIPWVPLIANLALPVVVFGLAVWIARRRSAGMLGVMLLAGLGLVAAVSLGIVAYVRATS
jgi:hypothetical protein